MKSAILSLVLLSGCAHELHPIYPKPDGVLCHHPNLICMFSTYGDHVKVWYQRPESEDPQTQLSEVHAFIEYKWWNDAQVGYDGSGHLYPILNEPDEGFMVYQKIEAGSN